MVFIFYAGSGRGFFVSIGISLAFSFLSNSANWDYGLSWGNSYNYETSGRGSPRSQRQKIRSVRSAPLTLLEHILAVASGVALLVLFCACCLLARPNWAQNRASRWFLRQVRRVVTAASTAWYSLLQAEVFRNPFQQYGWQHWGAAEQQGGSERRDRATQAEVNALPKDPFLNEAELLQWSPSSLKEELHRLQRQADFRFGYSGGSATRAMHNLLKGGGAVEKTELVEAVLKARGGDSGLSCSICLASYEAGISLRVLPCGHRFHAACVDKWLLTQSKTCPLCSKCI